MKYNSTIQIVLFSLLSFSIHTLHAEEHYQNQKVFKPFMNALEIPPVLQPISKDSTTDYYEINIIEKPQLLYKEPGSSEALLTRMWTYNGVFPGPTIIAQKGRRVVIKWNNKLPKKHLLNVDKDALKDMLFENSEEIHKLNKFKNLSDTEIRNYKAEDIDEDDIQYSRTITHLHGGVLDEENDGASRQYVTSGQSFTTDYSNHQDAEMLWYHDHSMDMTAINAYSGLAGGYIIRDAQENSLNLPHGKYEVPLVLTAKTFNKDMSLYYPEEMPPEMYGSVPLVNNKIMPYFEVEPRAYRFRMLNASNARYFNLAIKENLAPAQSNFLSKILQNLKSANRPKIFMIGADGGLFAHPIEINSTTQLKSIKLVPGTRADIIVDFSGLAGKEFILSNLYNEAIMPSVNEELNKAGIIDNIMLFKVSKSVSEPYTLHLPQNLKVIPKLIQTENIAAKKDFLIQNINQDFCTSKASDRVKGMMSFFGLPHSFPTIDQEKTKLGTTEVWRFVNTTSDPHPIHIHQGTFQVVKRSQIDMKMYEKNGSIVEIPMSQRAPEITELGNRDIAMVYPGETLEIVKKFNVHGRFLYHCHILEHEDMGMMRYFEVK